MLNEGFIFFNTFEGARIVFVESVVVCESRCAIPNENVVVCCFDNLLSDEYRILNALDGGDGSKLSAVAVHKAGIHLRDTFVVKDAACPCVEEWIVF